MKEYKHLFFDLDRTIWDFERNSKETLLELFEKYDIGKKCKVNFKDFSTKYKELNNMLWELYRKEEITKEVLSVKRFFMTFEYFGLNDGELARNFGEDYIKSAPTKTILFPGAEEALQKLSAKYNMHIITNGFEEVQEKKLSNSGLIKYFKTVVTSERAGCKKPEPGIFEFALQEAEAKPEESLMIGDDLKVDILGAKNLEIDQMYCNFENYPIENGVATHIVNDFAEIEDLLLN